MFFFYGFIALEAVKVCGYMLFTKLSFKIYAILKESFFLEDKKSKNESEQSS